ncbi:MAG: ATP-binding cassette domain-containing protein [Ilumatobacteraceae bacterium]
MAILGPNGAGKSTLIRTACGQLPLLGGARLFNGADVSAATPRHLVRNGLCTIPEGRGIFPNLTVRENLWMATYRDTNLADVEEMTYAQFPRLGERRSQLAGTMSGGEQQMLSLARALTTKPRVLLLDELSMGLAPMIVSELYEQVGRIAASGVAVLLVEQFASTVDKVANRSVLLTNGTIRWAGTPGELAGQDLTELYFGEAVRLSPPTEAVVDGPHRGRQLGSSRGRRSRHPAAPANPGVRHRRRPGDGRPVRAAAGHLRRLHGVGPLAGLHRGLHP